MANYDPRFATEAKVVGNDYASDGDLGFKNEVKGVFESYSSKGINLAYDFNGILGSQLERQNFCDAITESFQNDSITTDSRMKAEPFYDNYTERFDQLLNNSLTTIAQEAVMQGYSPIVAYTPFFLKKQWVSCIFKDVLMTEVPNSPVFNLPFERRYIKDQDGNRYEIPDVFYDNETMAKLNAAATGLSFKEDLEIDLPMKNVDVLVEKYFPGIVVNDRSNELTQDLRITEVYFATAKKWVPCDITADATTHTWLPKQLTDGAEEPEFDSLMGKVNFEDGTVSVVAENEKITKIKMAGKLANRWNERSLDVERKVDQIQKMMPESGPRFNTAITVEEASDAMALQKIDLIADNVDMMGRSLAEFEDHEIRSFLDNSYDRQVQARNSGVFGYQNSMVVTGRYDAMPYTGFTGLVSDWLTQTREYFERVIEELKHKLKTTEAVIVCVCNPTLVRYLGAGTGGVDWVFDSNTTISGIKIAYQFGIVTSAQDRIHLITSEYVSADTGYHMYLIPTTNELITYKHYKYNMVIDRGYRNPTHSLVPNVMATHRTLTFEVLPVQGRLTIDGRDLFSPATLAREGVGSQSFGNLQP